MSSVPTNMAKNKSRDVTCKPAIMDDLPLREIENNASAKFWRDKGEYYGIFERPITESLFSAFLSFFNAPLF